MSDADRRPKPPFARPALVAQILRAPHDALVQRALADLDTVRAELGAILPPALVQQLDFSTLARDDRSFVSPALRGSYGDLVFRVRLAGRPAFVYVLVEHKSAGSRRDLPQVNRYLGLAYDRLSADPAAPRYLQPVLPVLLSHGRWRRRGTLAFDELFDPALRAVPGVARHLPSFEVVHDDLAKLSDAALDGRRLGAFATIAFALLRDGRTRRMGATLRLRGRAILELRAADPDAYVSLICYIHAVARESLEPLLEEAPLELRSDVMTLAQQLIRQGRERGREEGLQLGLEQGLRQGIERGIERGREEGREEGQRATLRRQVARRFGELAPAVEQRLAAADAALLERLAERVLVATTVDELFDE